MKNELINLTGIKEEIINKEGIKNLLQRPKSIEGITKRQKEKLQNLSEFIRLYNQAEFINETTIINSSEKAGRFFLNLFDNITDKECFYVAFLNTQNEVIGYKKMFEGTIAEAAIYPREIIKEVLNHNANSIMVAHNHPGGSSSFSSGDISTTQNIKKALDTIQVKLLDHILCTPSKNYRSMSEQGLL